MALDVESPDPPDLTNRGLPAGLDAAEGTDGDRDLRREELERFLRDGAWNEAFQEWAVYTGLTVEEYRTVEDRGLVGRLDLYWDPADERLRFEVPDLPEEWDDEFASTVRVELSDLGRAAIEMLEDAYLDWDEEGTSDVFWSEAARDEERPDDD